MDSKWVALIVAVLIVVVLLFSAKSTKEKYGVLLNADGSRNRQFRPYIDQEETTRNLTLYDPNRPYYAGLYDSARPPERAWAEYVREQLALHPRQAQYIVSQNGTRTYPARPVPVSRGYASENGPLATWF